MKLAGSAIQVKNLEESINFYENILGLNLDMKVDAGEFNIAFLNSSSFRVELLESKNGEAPVHSENISFRFNVDSLDETMDDLTKKNISIHSGPFQPAPNVKFFFIKDPNGVLIQFAEEVK